MKSGHSGKIFNLDWRATAVAVAYKPPCQSTVWYMHSCIQNTKHVPSSFLPSFIINLTPFTQYQPSAAKCSLDTAPVYLETQGSAFYILVFLFYICIYA